MMSAVARDLQLAEVTERLRDLIQHVGLEKLEWFELLLAGAPITDIVKPSLDLLPRRAALQALTQRLWLTDLTADGWIDRLPPAMRDEAETCITFVLNASRADRERERSNREATRYIIGSGGSETPAAPRAYRKPLPCPRAVARHHPFYYEVREFRHLYALVTRDLRTYARQDQPPFTSDESLWFTFLIRGFLCSFHQWPRPTFAPYLALLRDGRADDTFRLAGHAFLHIAYDLPRTIADSLTPLCAAAPLDLAERSAYRVRYLGASPRFHSVMRTFLRRKHPIISWVSDNPPGRAFTGVLTQWAVALRTTAWVHGEVLADDTVQRSAREQRLLGAVHDAARDALDEGIFGIPSMHVNDFRAVLPIVWALPTWADALLASFAGAAAAVEVFHLVRAHREQRTLARQRDDGEREAKLVLAREALVQRVDRFGRLVFEYTTKALREQLES